MSSFTIIERKLARALDRYPMLKTYVKKAHSHVCFAIYGRNCATCTLNHDISITDALPTAISADYFFGYYDKSPWSPDAKSFLCQSVTSDSKLEIIVHDIESGRFNTVGYSHAWNYQQGSMAQWVDNNQILYNDTDKCLLGSRIVDLAGSSSRFIPWPVQAICPNGRQMISLNYKRLFMLRPEYGYEVDVSNFRGDMALIEDGLWAVDIESERGLLAISLVSLMEHEPRPEMECASHKVNHVMFSPRGDRYVFLHRWMGSSGKFSRLYVAESDTHRLRLLMDERVVSHFNWKNNDELLVWARTLKEGDRYYLVNVESGSCKVVGYGELDPYGDGHPSYSPDGRWIVTDTYPDKARQRHLILFDTFEERLVEIGRFFAPMRFDGPHRCDLHPRWSPDGKMISIDSAHDGQRKSYMIDIGSICQ